MVSQLIRYGNTAPKEEVPSILQMMLITFLLTMRDYFANLLPYALIAIFVIGGSPCTDLTYAGGDQGLLGICGPASVFFFTIHLALYLLASVIPGNRIRFFVENAGSMRIEHFRFMRGCLGLQYLQKADLAWCTSVLSPAKRLRIFFQNNTLHERYDAQVYHADDLSWPEDWSPLLIRERGVLREVHLQPFMRPITLISDLALRYHPSALLWRISYWSSRDRFAVLANLSDEKGIPAFQWNTIIPPIYLPAWKHLLKCFATGTTLQDVLPFFHNQSIELPFRFLTDQEVLQVSGLRQNFANVNKFSYLLTSSTVRSFVGNSFHPKLVSIALGTPEDLQEWVRGRRSCATNVAHPDTVRKYYIQLLWAVGVGAPMIDETPTESFVGPIDTDSLIVDGKALLQEEVDRATLVSHHQFQQGRGE